MFFFALFSVYGDYQTKQKAKQHTENLQNSNQNSSFSCVSLTAGPGATILGWPKSIY